jgi:hypothetical protein
MLRMVCRCDGNEPEWLCYNLDHISSNDKRSWIDLVMNVALELRGVLVAC